MKRRCMTLVSGHLAVDEKNAIYNSKAMDVFEERRFFEEQRKRTGRIL